MRAAGRSSGHCLGLEGRGTSRLLEKCRAGWKGGRSGDRGSLKVEEGQILKEGNSHRIQEARRRKNNS